MYFSYGFGWHFIHENQDDISRDKTVNEVPFNDMYKDHYKSNHGKSIFENISEKIDENEFYKLVSLDDFLFPKKTHYFTFIKKIKEYGIVCKDMTFMVVHYGPHLWKLIFSMEGR